MGTRIIEVRNSELTEEQKFQLAILEFRASDSTHVVWTYKAGDLQDLVDTIENLQDNNCLKNITYKIKKLINK